MELWRLHQEEDVGSLARNVKVDRRGSLFKRRIHEVAKRESLSAREDKPCRRNVSQQKSQKNQKEPFKREGRVTTEGKGLKKETVFEELIIGEVVEGVGSRCSIGKQSRPQKEEAATSLGAERRSDKFKESSIHIHKEIKKVIRRSLRCCRCAAGPCERC